MAASSEGRARRMHAHRHNMLLGNAGMMRQHLLAIIDSPTTTLSTKGCAKQMLAALSVLVGELRTRVNQDGSRSVLLPKEEDHG